MGGGGGRQPPIRRGLACALGAHRYVVRRSPDVAPDGTHGEGQLLVCVRCEHVVNVAAPTPSDGPGCASPAVGDTDTSPWWGPQGWAELGYTHTGRTAAWCGLVVVTVAASALAADLGDAIVHDFSDRDALGGLMLLVVVAAAIPSLLHVATSQLRADAYGVHLVRGLRLASIPWDAVSHVTTAFRGDSEEFELQKHDGSALAAIDGGHAPRSKRVALDRLVRDVSEGRILRPPGDAPLQLFPLGAGITLTVTLVAAALTIGLAA